MRLVALALALACAPTLAAAQPVATAPLAPNELLFQIQVLGTAHTPADAVFVTLVVSASGTDAATARAAGAALRQRLLDVARSFGAELAPAGDGGPQLAGFIGNEAVTTSAGELDGTPAHAPFQSNGLLQLRLHNPQRFAALRAALEQAGAANVGGPVYQLGDDTAARRAARLDALAKARAEAEAFALSQHMRVVRMVGFSEEHDPQREAMEMVMSQMNGRGSAPQSQVTTRISVQVSFALESR